MFSAQNRVTVGLIINAVLCYIYEWYINFSKNEIKDAAVSVLFTYFFLEFQSSLHLY